MRADTEVAPPAHIHRLNQWNCCRRVYHRILFTQRDLRRTRRPWTIPPAGWIEDCAFGRRYSDG